MTVKPEDVFGIGVSNISGTYIRWEKHPDPQRHADGYVLEHWDVGPDDGDAPEGSQFNELAEDIQRQMDDGSYRWVSKASESAVDFLTRNVLEFTPLRPGREDGKCSHCGHVRPVGSWDYRVIPGDDGTAYAPNDAGYTVGYWVGDDWNPVVRLTVEDHGQDAETLRSTAKMIAWVWDEQEAIERR